ncbi:TPA: helix-turn-helix domain-containing protein [Streptococcus pneumoniae]|uniref:S24 family peptidase n=1 Tax=Streptococcus pneumoniae TaxID=1313 RepID=UPI0007657D38|nr:S24 family peptidase [Streptococcus pneumoniae]MBW8125238.1 helix-turn-helix domain-containing protein [Streptococcus pneumoniae]MDV8373733.1 helix-turn-helix domain-containing protein [Streptococcus pneumoniae]MDV8622352.1 helix-turn-helix domain-containing protein [Streptococcus pneumoniae]MDV8683212.1 helix-turn-helix domain-containing protein [Streptococcus pneumoniae]MDV8716103.1 helix-turn-helix domain-containing protein [Streptococcus pneumoniae]
MKVENKEIFANNLSFYMEQKGVDRNTLCADLDLKYTTVRDWLKGITYPRIGKIELLANYFNINKSDLIENKIFTAQPSDSLLEEITNTARKLNTDNKKIVLRTSEELLESQENEEETKINEVSENIIRLDDYRQTTYRRVTGVVSAGSGSIQDDDLDMEVSFYEDEIPDDYDAIAYVVGNSMEPKIKNGDYLFIKNTQQVDYNTIGIFQVDGANYVKKLRQGYLESLNPDYEDIHLDESNNIRTIGEVVSVYREK